MCEAQWLRFSDKKVEEKLTLCSLHRPLANASLGGLPGQCCGGEIRNRSLRP